jgi:hypothetical protein
LAERLQAIERAAIVVAGDENDVAVGVKEYWLTNGFSIDPIKITRRLGFRSAADSIFKYRPKRSLNSLTREWARSKSSLEALEGTSTGTWLSSRKPVLEAVISRG